MAEKKKVDIGEGVTGVFYPKKYWKIEQTKNDYVLIRKRVR